MTAKDCNKFTEPKKKLSLQSALGLLARISLLASPVLAVPLIGVAATVFNSGFEQGFSGWEREVCCTQSAQIVSSPVRAGKSAVKFTLNSSDSDVAGSKRAEMKLGRVAANSEYTYRFSTFLPSSYTADPSFEIIGQWHENPDFDLGETWRSPPLSLMTVDGQWQIHRRWDPNRVTRDNEPGPGGGTESIRLGSYATNVWTDWVFHVKWSYGADGILEIWKNGQLVFKKTGPNTYNDAIGTYFKIGIYKPDWKSNPGNSNTNQRVIYYDQVRVAQGGAEEPPDTQAIRDEAENMFLSAYRIESGNSAASGSALISLRNASDTTDTASSTFSGDSGKYDVYAGYFDENDGAASLQVSAGGVRLADWQLNQNLADNRATPRTLARKKVGSKVSINKGARIEIKGTANKEEWARVDYIEFVPVP